MVSGDFRTLNVSNTVPPINIKPQKNTITELTRIGLIPQQTSVTTQNYLGSPLRPKQAQKKEITWE